MKIILGLIVLMVYGGGSLFAYVGTCYPHESMNEDDLSEVNWYCACQPSRMCSGDYDKNAIILWDIDGPLDCEQYKISWLGKKCSEKNYKSDPRLVNGNIQVNDIHLMLSKMYYLKSAIGNLENYMKSTEAQFDVLLKQIYQSHDSKECGEKEGGVWHYEKENEYCTGYS